MKQVSISKSLNSSVLTLWHDWLDCFRKLQPGVFWGYLFIIKRKNVSDDELIDLEIDTSFMLSISYLYNCWLKNAILYLTYVVYD